MRDKEQKLENVETSHTLGEASCTTRYIDLTEIAIVRVGFVKDKSQNVEAKVYTFLCAVAHKNGDQRHRRLQSVLTRRHPHPTRPTRAPTLTWFKGKQSMSCESMWVAWISTRLFPVMMSS